jgi:hypothetical protein
VHEPQQRRASAQGRLERKKQERLAKSRVYDDFHAFNYFPYTQEDSGAQPSYNVRRGGFKIHAERFRRKTALQREKGMKILIYHINYQFSFYDKLISKYLKIVKTLLLITSIMIVC